MDKWQYKTFLTSDPSEAALNEKLDQEGADGWELAAISLQIVTVPEDADVPAGYSGAGTHNLTGAYLVVLKKRLEQPGANP
jgi:hypothetical protein